MWIDLEKRKGQENECSVEAEVEGALRRVYAALSLLHRSVVSEMKKLALGTELNQLRTR